MKTSTSENEMLPRFSKIKGVTFDLDGCLYDARKMRWRFILGNLRKGALMRVNQSVRAGLRDVAFDDGAAFFTAQYAEIARRTEKDIDDVKQEVETLFGPRLCNVLSRIGPFQRTREALALLVEKGLKIAVVSDFSPDDKLKALGLLDLPWTTTIGADGTGALKPHPRSLQLAATRMGLKPAECLHIGDRLDTDILGAKKAGFQSLFIDPSHRGPAAASSREGYANLVCAKAPFDAAAFLLHQLSV